SETLKPRTQMTEGHTRHRRTLCSYAADGGWGARRHWGSAGQDIQRAYFSDKPGLGNAQCTIWQAHAKLKKLILRRLYRSLANAFPSHGNLYATPKRKPPSLGSTA